jgi:hypothetical protein
LKKIAVILLMGVLLLNWYAYHFVAAYFENKAATDMQAQLDINNYSEADLITIKVPLSLPYGPNSQNFERVNGSIDIDGVNYQYVKRRMYNDTLELKCIPNTAKTTIKNARDEFSKLASDFVNLNTSKKSSGNQNHPVKYSVQDFTGDHYFDLYQLTAFLNPVYFQTYSQFNNSSYLQRLEQPPEL